jgi:hypothetical protein
MLINQKLMNNDSSSVLFGDTLNRSGGDFGQIRKGGTLKDLDNFISVEMGSPIRKDRKLITK